MRSLRFPLISALVLAPLSLVLCRRTAADKGPGPAAAKVVLVVHGGAGVLTDKEMLAEGLKREQFERALTLALSAGYQALKRQGTTSVDGVEAAIRVLEDCDLFNAGKG